MAADPSRDTSPLVEIASVLVHFDHFASLIENANHSVMRTAEKICIADCVADSVWLAIPQATERQGIGRLDQSDVYRGAVG
jgi:hypothetical protein